MPHPELAAEQAHVDLAYRRVEAMRANALAALQDAYDERGGTFQAATERDIRVRSVLHRLEQLQLGDEALVFGRIDRKAAPPEGPPIAEAFHIGRLAVADEELDPLVVDWRAPVAEPFYRATGAHPMGLTRRRHFLVEGRRLEDLEDELFGDGVDGGGGLGLSGSSVLLAALERSRTGRMHDIVATVQREQDEIIRGPLPGVLVVQGGPGTGKTAVALHRAAYLLYTYRFPLEHQGVLVVGPNPLFLRYIEHVLPSLGETGVELSTVGGLFSEEKAATSESRSTGRLKGDPRMIRLIAHAVADRQRRLPRALDIGFGAHQLRLSTTDSAEIVATARRRGGTHNARRRLVETLMWRRLHQQYEEAEDRARRTGLRGQAEPPAGAEPDDDDEPAVVAGPIDPVELGRQLRKRPEIVEALDRMWPILSPQQLLHDLFGAPPLIKLAARDLLNEAEQALLRRPRCPSVEQVAWSEPDLALLDEAQALLGTRRRRPARSGEGVAQGEIRTFGHIVVDEAQDLSPMQLRMLARRSLAGSMTVVGDIAQGTGEWSPQSWDEVLVHLPARRPPRVVELAVNYRTPSEIMELAGLVLAEVAPGFRLPESVRSTGVKPRVVAIRAPSPASGQGPFPNYDVALGAAVARVTAEEVAAVGGESMSGGRVAVICPASLTASLASSLREGGVPFGEVGQRALDEPVSLVPLEMAKGLEFDAVVVVEPTAIGREAAQGLRALYVAMTRSTKRLTLVHAEPLPPVLAHADEAAQ